MKKGGLILANIIGLLYIILIPIAFFIIGVSVHGEWSGIEIIVEKGLILMLGFLTVLFSYLGMPVYSGEYEKNTALRSKEYAWKAFIGMGIFLVLAPIGVVITGDGDVGIDIAGACVMVASGFLITGFNFLVNSQRKGFPSYLMFIFRFLAIFFAMTISIVFLM